VSNLFSSAFLLRCTIFITCGLFAVLYTKLTWYAISCFSQARASQTSLCLAASPPPQIKKERVAGFALPRHTGHTLFSSFWGGDGKRKKTFEKPC